MPTTIHTNAFATATNIIWSDWQTNATTATTSWYTWCDTTSTASTAAWDVWTFQNRLCATQIEAYAARAELYGHQVRRLDEGARRVHASFHAENEKRLAEERAKRQVAERRAEELLMANLNLQQREQFAKHRAFIVHGRNARYRIRKGRSGNIDVLGKDDRVVDRLCCHPSKWTPDFDTMLAQLLWLNVAEDEFVRKANRHGPGAGERVLLEAA